MGAALAAVMMFLPLLLIAGVLGAAGDKWPMLKRVGVGLSGSLFWASLLLFAGGFEGQKRPGFLGLFLALYFFYVFAAKFLAFYDDDAPDSRRAWPIVAMAAAAVSVWMVTIAEGAAESVGGFVLRIVLMAVVFDVAIWITRRLRVSEMGRRKPLLLPFQLVVGLLMGGGVFAALVQR